MSGGTGKVEGQRKSSGKPLFAKSGFPDLSPKTLKWLPKLYEFGDTTVIHNLSRDVSSIDACGSDEFVATVEKLIARDLNRARPEQPRRHPL